MSDFDMLFDSLFKKASQSKDGEIYLDLNLNAGRQSNPNCIRCPSLRRYGLMGMENPEKSILEMRERCKQCREKESLSYEFQ